MSDHLYTRPDPRSLGNSYMNHLVAMTDVPTAVWLYGTGLGEKTMTDEAFEKLFREWWHGGGYKTWAKLVDKDILSAINTVFIAALKVGDYDAGLAEGRRRGMEEAARIAKSYIGKRIDISMSPCYPEDVRANEIYEAIRRKNAILNDMRKVWKQAIDEYGEVCAERDRLQREVERLQKNWEGAENEVKRLQQKNAELKRPIKCTQCPHEVGDSYQRDCAFPDCMGGWETAFRTVTSELRQQLTQARAVLKTISTHPTRCEDAWKMQQIALIALADQDIANGN